ncbi:MAG TPA: glycosyl hydrolase family 8, partial [Polyangiaceae bacterium]|nr:glycosyl hydrolase family 8 [Polyangiaceae bacterium]
PSGGSTTGGAPSGGSTTGGAPSGGASTGGAPSGGWSTGGAPSGGSSTGGATTGGTSSGGTTTCGAPGPQGERYPFPQNVRYPYGVQSSAISNDFVRNWYDTWRSHFLQECNGNLRPGVDPLTTSLVEAQGFATIAAAYMGDKDAVDRLYAFYLSKTASSSCGLQGWKVDCNGVIDQGAATDGDIDVASGLIVAHWQWPDDGYDEKARTLLSNLKAIIADCGGLSAVYPGCSGGRPWGGCNETDISYYSPGFFRYFAKISGDEAWTKLADDTHVIRDAAAHPTTGLVPDWQSVSGTAGAGSRKGYFSFDAIRAPFKSGLDYLWSGNAAAGAWCQKLSSWAYGQGVGSIVDGYNLDGSRAGSNHNLAVVGSMAVCAMANTQDVADAFAQESGRLNDSYWYSKYLGNLYLLALTGNMWNIDLVPSCD